MDTAQQLKEIGQDRALQAAGQMWSDQAIGYLRRFVKTLDRDQFTFDEFRAWALERGLDEPYSLNAWGSLPKIAEREDICVSTGRAVPARRPASHGRLVRVWRIF